MGPEAHQGSGTIGPFAFWPSIGSVLDEDNPGPLRTYILGFIRRLWLFFFFMVYGFFPFADEVQALCQTPDL